MKVGVAYDAPLLGGSLLRRYERFIAEVRLDDGREVRAHCVNPGRMEGLVQPGARVWLSRALTERKLPYTWEQVELEGQRIGVNTIVPNRLVRSLLEARAVKLPPFTLFKAEQKFGRGHRVDFKLETPEGPHLLEVKNCHLRYPDACGYFPDSFSERASSHASALMRVAKKGSPASIFFTVQRADVTCVRPSALHDAAFAKSLRAAAAAGVTVRAFRFVPDADGLWFDAEIGVDLKAYNAEQLRSYCTAYDATSGWVRSNGKWAGQTL